MSRKAKKIVCRASKRKVFSTSLERSSFSTPKPGRINYPWAYHVSACRSRGQVRMQIAYLVITILFAVRVAFSGLGKIHRDPHQMQVVYKTVGYPDAGAMLSAGAICSAASNRRACPSRVDAGMLLHTCLVPATPG
jgi:hypothetical protein